MTIKKFEARTMKEALEMVKTQLGPDAVILSAKEVTKGFGIGGVKSIEITAAYSEAILKQKQFAQSKMTETTKEKFSRISAKSQKEIMQRMIEDKIRESQNKENQNRYAVAGSSSTESKISSTGGRKYIEIDEDQNPMPKESNFRSEKPQIRSLQSRYEVKNNELTGQAQNQFDAMDVKNLQTEIEQLKKMIQDFKHIPQTFIGNHPGAEHGVDFNLSGHFDRLLKRGLLPEVAGQILAKVQNLVEFKHFKNSQIVEAAIAKVMLQETSVDHDILSQKFHLFFGPSGSGKSSSMIKLASHLILKEHKRVALISTDTIKVGADEQMKIFSQILNIPFVSIRSPADWAKLMPYLSQVDYVMVDFASMSLKNEDELTYLKQMMPPVSEVSSHLVLSAKSKDSDVLDIARRYNKIGFENIIFTSLDEATLYGTLFNANQLLNKPLFAFGIGAKIPDDIEMATAERVLDLILEITKNSHQMDHSL